ncbi:hypothetical protein NHP190012_15980 [Helicobacter sp. NHP19-012]|uniref:Uncharacterized protein n=1 Tax=Helicobacter gastrofelis TaxID=2849642 RepID=A0ABN6I919_9HELI|nr:hypothetical protein [Helicobacter sp. NHP19-012]BCZ19956.1 hypothetical protein NHP190012_15980 [Helicobacter sp. NHP19-012]
MPLPWIIGGIALAVIGGIAILSISQFLSKIRELKEKLERERRRRFAAKIKAMYDAGDHAEVHVGLLDGGREIDTETYKVDKEDAIRELREGMTL